MQKSKSQKLMCMFLSVPMGAMMLPTHEISAATMLAESTTGSEDGYDDKLGNVEVQYLTAKN